MNTEICVHALAEKQDQCVLPCQDGDLLCLHRQVPVLPLWGMISGSWRTLLLIGSPSISVCPSTLLHEMMYRYVVSRNRTNLPQYMYCG